MRGSVAVLLAITLLVACLPVGHDQSVNLPPAITGDTPDGVDVASLGGSPVHVVNAGVDGVAGARHCAAEPSAFSLNIRLRNGDPVEIAALGRDACAGWALVHHERVTHHWLPLRYLTPPFAVPDLSPRITWGDVLALLDTEQEHCVQDALSRSDIETLSTFHVRAAFGNERELAFYRCLPRDVMTGLAVSFISAQMRDRGGVIDAEAGACWSAHAHEIVSVNPWYIFSRVRFSSERVLDAVYSGVARCNPDVAVQRIGAHIELHADTDAAALACLLQLDRAILQRGLSANRTEPVLIAELLLRCAPTASVLFASRALDAAAPGALTDTERGCMTSRAWLVRAVGAAIDGSQSELATLRHDLTVCARGR